jgi:uncharacterized GH25 family protein
MPVDRSRATFVVLIAMVCIAAAIVYMLGPATFLTSGGEEHSAAERTGAARAGAVGAASKPTIANVNNPDSKPADTASRVDPNPAMCTMSGQVVDPAGRPVAGAVVSVAIVEWIDRQQGTRTTGADGRFEFPIREPLSGFQTVRVRARGFAPFAVDTYQIAAPRFDLGILTLSPVGRVAGKVLSPDGAPVPNARIYVWKQNWTPPWTQESDAAALTETTALTTTNADGIFTFDSIESGETKVGVGCDGYADYVTDIEIEDGEERRLEIKLTRGGATAAVVQDETGRPVRDARLRRESCVAPWRRNITSDAEGRIQIWLSHPVDRADTVAVEKLGYGVSSRSVFELQADPRFVLSNERRIASVIVRIPPEENPTKLPVVFICCLYRVGDEWRSRVHDSTVRGAEKIDNSRYRFWLSTRSSHGDFTESPVAGPIRLQVLLLRDVILETPAFEAPKATDPEMEIVACGSGAAPFVGVIRDANGKPLADMTVSAACISREGESLRNFAKTNSEGRFTIHQLQPTGVQIAAEGHDAVLELTTIPTWTPGVEQVFVASRGARIGGSVRVDGKIPASPVFVCIYTDENEPMTIFSGWHVTRCIPTDASGNFESGALHAGNYRVCVYAKITCIDDGIVERPDAELTLANGESRTLALNITNRISARVRGRVTLDGEPLANAQVRYGGTADSAKRASVYTNSFGTFRFWVHDAGRVDISVQHQELSRTESVDVTDGANINISLDLEKK